MTDETENEQRIVYKVIKREGQQMVSAVAPFPYAIHYPYYQWYHSFLPMFVFLDREDAVEWLVRVRWVNNEEFELWRGNAKEAFQVYSVMNYPADHKTIQWYWDNLDLINYALDKPNNYNKPKTPFITDNRRVIPDNDLAELINLISQSWFICPAPDGTYATRDLILTEKEDF